MSSTTAIAEDVLGHAPTSLFSKLTPTDMQSVRDAALRSGTQAIVGLGTLGALSIGKDKLRERELARHHEESEEHLQNILAKNPDLLKHDPERVRELYSTMREIAPSLSTKPHIAGSWIQDQIEFRNHGVPLSSVSDLASLQKAHEETVHGKLNISPASAFVTNTSMFPKGK